MTLAKTLKKPLTLVMAAAMTMGLAAPVTAQADETREALVVTMRDGKTDHYFLFERPEVTYQGTTCKISSESFSTDYSMAEIEKAEIKFLEYTGIDSTELSTDFTVDLSDPARVVMTGLEPGCSAFLYSIDGIMVASTVADTDGRAVITLESLPSAIYIVHTQTNKTFKIYKR